jgi:hypothetical protein
MIRTVVISLGVLAAIGAGLAWLLVSSFPDASNTGYRVTMRPIPALSHRACQAEVRRLGMVVEATACSPRPDRPWFDITIINIHDKNGYPDCTPTAYDKAGHALFDSGIPIWRPTTITRYKATCHGRSSSQVPI